MQIILLSGGSGTRLWPLSNDARSKQFLKVLDKEGSKERESMVQRVMSQIKQSGLVADITIATSVSQKESVLAQLGSSVNVVTEPCRRDTFPAICLACEYLAKVKGCDADEIVVVMPCDPYTEIGYFDSIKRMASSIESSWVKLMVMGIHPTYPSSKYGYVVPDSNKSHGDVFIVKRFTEKPDEEVAKALIEQGAQWNGGVFAFKLGYLTSISEKYVKGDSFSEIRERYEEFPKISFDYEVAEKADSVGMVEYHGNWKDLGTWNTLTDELTNTEYGNVITDSTSSNTHILNELNIPLLCMGTENLIVAASPDGILVAEKSKCENIKQYAEKLKQRPMYEELSWGSYRIIDIEDFSKNNSTIIKRISILDGKSTMPKQYHQHSVVLVVLNGNGELTIGEETKVVSASDTITIQENQCYSLKAHTSMDLVEIIEGPFNRYV